MDFSNVGDFEALLVPATDSEQRVIKLLQIYDAKIVGTANNAAAPRNDVVLRAVYEF